MLLITSQKYYIAKRIIDETVLRKKDMLIGEKDFERAIDNLLISNKL